MTECCIAHISELKCKCEDCEKIKEVRYEFREEVHYVIKEHLNRLRKLGYTKEQSLRTLRREMSRRNKIQHDIYDEIALKLWREV